MSFLSGWLGEKFAAFGMWLSLDSKVYRRFHNLVVPSSNGTTQIDHLIVSPFGLFVIETKNIRGWIFGSVNQPNWTQSLYGRNYSFQNPLRQNYRHTKCLVEFLGIDHSLIHPIVYFIGDCEFKTSMPRNVLANGLSTYVLEFQQRRLSDDQVQRVVASIESLKTDKSLNRRTHLHSLSARHASTSTCPKCGKKLVERTARKGPTAGSKFTGCSGYPNCKYTRPL